MTYLNGLTSPFGGTPYDTALGDTSYVAKGFPGSTGLLFPSAYIPSSSYPIYLNELVGAFADNTGKIVGTPFVIGLGTTVYAPIGATHLYLGLNDDDFSDNTETPGGLRVSIESLPTAEVPPAPAIPEPSTWAMLLIGFAGVGHMTYRRRHFFAREIRR